MLTLQDFDILLLTQQFCWYFYPRYITNGKSKTYQLYHFPKEPSKIFQVQLNILPKLYWCFAAISRKHQKWAIFDNLMTIILGANMITRQKTSLFSSTIWALSVDISFFYFKTLKIQFHGVLFLHYVLVCKMHTCLPKMTFSSLLTQICFFDVKFC